MSLSKRLMQTFLPTGGWRCVLSHWYVELLFPPCWLFGLKHPSTGARTLLGEVSYWWEMVGSYHFTQAHNGMLIDMSHYHRLMPMSTPQSYRHQCLCLCSEPLTLPLTSTGNPTILRCRFGPGFYEVSALISLCSGVHENFLCTFHESSFCFLYFCGIPAIKPHWP